MTLESLLVFVPVSLLLILAPGPDNILVLTQGITMGRRAAMLSAAGASVGLVCHSILAAAGLSAIVQQSSAAFAIVRYVGAAYLLVLGVRSLISRGETIQTGSQVPPIGPRRIFIQGLLSNVMNPKIAIFFWPVCPNSPRRPPHPPPPIDDARLAVRDVDMDDLHRSRLVLRGRWRLDPATPRDDPCHRPANRRCLHRSRYSPCARETGMTRWPVGMRAAITIRDRADRQCQGRNEHHHVAFKFRFRSNRSIRDSMGGDRPGASGVAR